MNSQKNLYSLVTGASKRIGALIAKTFACAEVNLILHYNKSKIDAEKLKEEILESNPNLKIFLIQGDLSTNIGLEKFIKNLHDLINENQIFVKFLINNASIFERTNFFSSQENLDQNHSVSSNFDSENTFFLQNLTIHLTTPLFLIKFLNQFSKTKNDQLIVINMLDIKRASDLDDLGFKNYKDKKNYFSYNLTKHFKFLMHLYLKNESEQIQSFEMFAFFLGYVLPQNEDEIIKDLFKMKNIQEEDINEKLKTIESKIKEIIDHSTSESCQEKNIEKDIFIE